MKKHHWIGIIAGAAIGYWAAAQYGNAPGSAGYFFTLPDQISRGAVGGAIGIPVEGALSGAAYGILLGHLFKKM